MKNIFSLLCMSLFAIVSAFGQTTTLTFTGRDSHNNFITLDRVVITDITQNWQETIIYPDTILVMGSTGIGDVDNANTFGLSQNVPNPFDGVSDFCLSLPKDGKVHIEVLSLDGKKMADYSSSLPSWRAHLQGAAQYAPKLCGYRPFRA